MTPLKISYQVIENSANNVDIRFKPYHFIYYPEYTRTISGVEINSQNPSEGDFIFATLQDAIAYLLTHGEVPTMVENINTDKSTDYTVGESTVSVPDIQSTMENLLERVEALESQSA